MKIRKKIVVLLDYQDSEGTLCSPSGQHTHKYLKHILGEHNILIDHAYPGVIIDDLKDPVTGQKTAYAQYLEDQALSRLRSARPDLIITMGQIPLSLISPAHTVNEEHSYLIHTTYGLTIPTFAPRQMLVPHKGAEAIVWITKTFRKAQEFLTLGSATQKEILYTHNDPQKTKLYLEACLKSKEVCIDLETERIKNDLPSTLKSIGVSKSPFEAIAFTPDISNWNELCLLLKQICEDKNIRKVGQNFGMFDALVLRKILDIKCQGTLWDTMNASRMLFPDFNASLRDLARLYLKTNPWKDDSWNAYGNRLRVYNAKDVTRTYQIAALQQAEFKARGCYDYYTRVTAAVEFFATETVWDGLTFDVALQQEYLKKAKEHIKPIKAELVTSVHKYLPKATKKKKVIDYPNCAKVNVSISEDDWKLKADDLFKKYFSFLPQKEKKEYIFAKKAHAKKGLTPFTVYKKEYKQEISFEDIPSFNPNSSPQIKGILNNMGVSLPVVKRAATKDYAESTNRAAMEKLLVDDNTPEEAKTFIVKLIDYKNLAKFTSAYLNGRAAPDGKWRGFINIRGTETGRARSKKYYGNVGGNIQNIPRDPRLGMSFKRCFPAPPGYLCWNFDQASAEAKIVAYLAKCDKMIERINAGEDLHLLTASVIHGIPEEELKQRKKAGDSEFKKMRQAIKAVAHGAHYKLGPKTLAQMMLLSGHEISVEEAKRMMEAYFDLYPEIRTEFHAYVENEIKTKHTLVNPFGATRLFLTFIDHAALRKAIAHIPQSTIPDISNLMWRFIRENIPHDLVKVAQQGHDSLFGYVKEDYKETFQKQFEEAADKIIIPIRGQEIKITWDYDFGETWADC